MRTRLLLLVGSIVFPLLATSQAFFNTKKYTTGTYRNPLDIPMSLVGNFGECRPNHFHSGIDIRTNQVENLAVRSIADGYISRVKIEAGGFGNAIYITHPNGITSVYAHLNRFFDALENYVRNQQYQIQQWKIDLSFLPHQFPVHKGDFIARSGNTGSSQGPHLHLEIRDTKSESPLNPLLFFTQLSDTRSPQIKQLALYDATKSIYHQKPQLYPVRNGKPGKDTLIVASDEVYCGIQADDFMEGAAGTLGVYELNVYLDDQPLFGWQLERISYDSTRYMNAMADYKTKKNNGPWIQLCHKLPNDRLPVYKSFQPTHGKIDLRSRNARKVKIVVKDMKGNSSSIQFVLSTKHQSTANGCAKPLEAGKPHSVTWEGAVLELTEEALYDHVCIEGGVQQGAKGTTVQVHYSDIPLHTYSNLKIKMGNKPTVGNENKLAFVRQPFGKETKGKGKRASYKNGMAEAAVRELGTYVLVEDRMPPAIATRLNSGDKLGKALQFIITEETTTVDSVALTVDGKWLRLAQKGDRYFYESDSHFPSGIHQVEITAWDENRNKSSKQYQIKR